MFWWLLTPFVGHDLGKATAELEQKTTDRVVERCAVLSFEREQLAVRSTIDAAKELARSGYFGSTIPDQVRIFELERRVQMQQQIIETYQLAFEKMSWLEDQEER